MKRNIDLCVCECFDFVNFFVSFASFAEQIIQVINIITQTLNLNNWEKYYQIIIFPGGQEVLNIAFSLQMSDTFPVTYLSTNFSAIGARLNSPILWSNLWQNTGRWPVKFYHSIGKGNKFNIETHLQKYKNSRWISD